MLATAMIVLVTFIAMLVLIALGKGDRTAIALVGALITYFSLYTFGEANFEDLKTFLVGSPTDGFLNLHTLIFVFSILMIVEIAKEGGVFQFLAFKIAQVTRGDPKKLLIMLSLTTILITAMISDMLAIFIILPLTIVICRMIQLNPMPYIISQIIVIKNGAIVFLTSSISNIIISVEGGISFTEFLLNVGLMALVLIGITIAVFLSFFQEDLKKKPENVTVLLQSNAWNYVPNRRLMYKSSIALIAMITCFFIIPDSLIPTDLIALTVAVILFTICRLNPVETFKKIDFKLIFYLLGIFVVTGGLEETGFVDTIASVIGGFGSKNVFAVFAFLLWVSGYLSAPVDNIAIVRVLVPIADAITTRTAFMSLHVPYYGIAFGVNLGDNLFPPSGDSLIGISIAEREGFPVNMRHITIIGFVTTNIQLFVIMLVYAFLYNMQVGLILVAIALPALLIIHLGKKLKRGKSNRNA